MAFMAFLPLEGGLFVVLAWLQLRRTTPAELQEKRGQFYGALIFTALFLGMFVLYASHPAHVPPNPLGVAVSLLGFLALLMAVVRELVRAFKAKRANRQRSRQA
jgi:hypothetical protein